MVRRALSGLRVRLSLLVLLAVLPIVGLVLYDAVEARRTEAESISQQVSQLAQLASSSVAQVVEGERQLLVAMSRLPAVVGSDVNACNAVMVDLLGQYEQYSNLGALTPDGVIFCTAIPQSLGTSVADRTYYLRALAAEDFAMGDYQIGRISGIAVVVAAYPVYQAGQLQAVVFASLALSELDRIIASVELPPGAALTVVDHNGTILARNPDPDRYVGQVLSEAFVNQAAVAGEDAASLLTGVDGVTRLYAFSDVPGTHEAGLRVAVGLPTAVAFAGVISALWRNLVTLGVVTLVAFSAAWLGSSAFVLRPIATLVNATRALAGGNLAARIGGPYGAGEVGRLAEAFDGMAEGLHLRSAQLTRVNRMLKMLSECNQALVRATTEPQLLGDVCDSIVGYGEYALAWVRLAPADQLPAPATPTDPAAFSGDQPAAIAALEAAAAAQGPAPTAAVMLWSELPGPASVGQPVTLAAFRLVLRGEHLGRLYLATTQPAGFSLDETQLLEELADDLAFGLMALRGHTAREVAEAQVRAGAERTLAIANIGRDLAAVTTDYQACMDTLVRRLAELVGDGALVTILDDSAQWLHPVASYHAVDAHHQLARQLLGAGPIRADADVSARVLRTGEPVVVAAPSPEHMKAAIAAEFWPYIDQYPLHTILVVPLRAQGRIFGTIALWRDLTRTAFMPNDQEFVLDLADRAALAVANARLYAAVHDQNAALELRVAERTSALAASNAALAAENAERRRVEAEVQQTAAEIQDLYEHAPCGYHSLNPAGVFVRINTYELDLIGYARAEVIGQLNFGDLLTPASREQFHQSYPAFMERGWVNNVEYELVNRAGRAITVLLSATAVRDADGRYLMSRATMLDITDRKAAEEQIQQLNATLRQRAAALEAANRELEAFSYSVSHDLRAPLRSIDGFSLAMLEDYGPQLDPVAHDYLSRVRGAAQRMAALIDDLLNLSRVSRSDMRWELVDLSALAAGVVEDLQHAQPERAVTVRIAPDLAGTGDSRLLRVALENLLNNAWKFTSKQPDPVIEVGAAEVAGLPAFFVRDNGAGFDMAYAQRLFGAFQRLHDQQEYAGTGIGLATVQRILNRHGGRAWAVGQVGAGATFYFTLPTDIPPAG